MGQADTEDDYEYEYHPTETEVCHTRAFEHSMPRR